MSEEMGLFEAMYNCRAMRRLDTREVPEELLVKLIEAANQAPSGSNMQNARWIVVRDPAVKARIREAAEAEEREFYGGRAPQEWLDALSHLGTDDQKPFLETAPALVVIFQKNQVENEDGETVKTYYPKESVGIATGFLISALHHAGLATLTHTPSPMKFLTEILERPSSEKPFLLLVVGYPTKDCEVPVITKKPLEDIASFH